MLEMVLGRKFKDWLKDVFTLLLILIILNLHASRCNFLKLNIFGCNSALLFCFFENPIFMDFYFFYTEMILILGGWGRRS